MIYLYNIIITNKNVGSSWIVHTNWWPKSQSNPTNLYYIMNKKSRKNLIDFNIICEKTS